MKRILLASLALIATATCVFFLFGESGSPSGQGTRDPIFSNTENKVVSDCPESPFVLFLMGQSNAANAIELGAKTPRTDVFNYYGGNCYHASYPLLGATGSKGSLGLLLADGIETDRPIVIATLAIGGTKIDQWAHDPEFNSVYSQRADELRKQFEVVDLVLWIQGESDIDTEILEFSRSLRTFLEMLQRDFPEAQIGLTGSSYCLGRENPEIVGAQEMVANDLDMIFLGSTDNFKGSDDRYDDCHFSESGAAKVSEMILSNLPRLDR